MSALLDKKVSCGPFCGIILGIGILHFSPYPIVATVIGNVNLNRVFFFDDRFSHNRFLLTQPDYVKRILKVLIYIEDHIEEEISIEELAKVSCHSPFHFHRIFHMVVGETVYKYVRRLMLEKAASKLRYTERPITDIAMDTQYDTPSAFTRAFKQTI